MKICYPVFHAWGNHQGEVVVAGVCSVYVTTIRNSSKGYWHQLINRIGEKHENKEKMINYLIPPFFYLKSCYLHIKRSVCSTKYLKILKLRLKECSKNLKLAQQLDLYEVLATLEIFCNILQTRFLLHIPSGIIFRRIFHRNMAHQSLMHISGCKIRSHISLKEH